MQPSSLLRPTFRLKLLVALLATIAPLLLVTLLVVRHEADRQVEGIVKSTAARALEAFTRIEKLRQQQLDQLGRRFAESTRIAAAMLEADTALLVDQTNYELQYVGYPNASFGYTDIGGDPIVGTVSKTGIEHLFAGDTAVFGYQMVGDRLFSIHPVIVVLNGQPLGIAQFGFAIDESTAKSLGAALGAEVCFKVGKHCVASSEKLHANRFANISQPLPGAAEIGTQIAMRIPLDEVVRPFTAILRAIRVVGVAVLILAIIIAVFLSRGLAHPVRALVSATERVARGDYSARVIVKSRDELGTLADAFNEMTHGLLLKEKYRGVLDKVVSRDVADEMLKGEIQLGGEIRDVTTLFADVRGFTAMSEHMDAQEVVALLNQVMDRAEAAVVAEGGVVDKYVGDEIMALFGAPIAGEDDALRAVRAATRIQEEVATINDDRARRGEPPISLGIGINSGRVVAGNMGSARRLNYTVIGAPVNLAARVCSEAEGGQTLVTEATLDRVRDKVTVESMGERTMKGVARPIELFKVVALSIALLFAAVSTGSAQRVFEFGRLQVQPSLRADGLLHLSADEPAWMLPDSSGALFAPRVSAFLDIFFGKHFYSLIELRLDRGETPSPGNLQARIEQAFLRITPFAADANLQVGRFVSPFGGYPQRHHSPSDPLIRPPLTYDYRTMMRTDLLPLANDGFIDWKDNRFFLFRPRGAPPVWNAPYQLGAMLLGGAHGISVRLAAMNGAPSVEPNVWNELPDDLGDVSIVANIGAQLSPELRVGISLQNGAYLESGVDTLLAPGRSRSDYPQRMVGAELTATRGLVEVRAEFVHDSWKVPRVNENAIDNSYYIEGKLKVAAGAFIAARYSAIRFNELTYTGGGSSQWDYNVDRVQVGAGYRIRAPLEIRAEYMINRMAGPIDPRDNLLSLQISWQLNN